MKQHVRSTLFRSPRSKLLAAGASFAAIALFVLILPASVASGQTSASTSTLQNGRRLAPRSRRRKTASGSRCPTSDSGGSTHPSRHASTPSVGVSTAQLSPRAGPSPASWVEPSTAYAGLRRRCDRGRGQRRRHRSPCSGSTPDQTLTMNLGAGSPARRSTIAEIDIEGKFGGSLTIEGYFVPTTRARRWSGHPETYTRQGRTRARTRAIATTSASGSQRAEDPVNRLVFTRRITRRARSLEGGSDGTILAMRADLPKSS